MSYLGCSVHRYLHLFVGGIMSYLGCSVHRYLQLFVGGTMSYLGCSVHHYLQLFVGGTMSYLRYLFLSSYREVQHILYCVCFVFLRIVCSMLPVSPDCPF
jgi:hypothetical protein